MEEAKIKFAYQITVYENGDIDATPVEVDGTPTVSNDEMFRHIREVADRVHLKDVENAAYVGTLKAIRAVNEATDSAMGRENFPTSIEQ